MYREASIIYKIYRKEHPKMKSKVCLLLTSTDWEEGGINKEINPSEINSGKRKKECIWCCYGDISEKKRLSTIIGDIFIETINQTYWINNPSIILFCSKTAIDFHLLNTYIFEII
jgi:hypothetical protein